jgi:phosphoglycolate phosphatase
VNGLSSLPRLVFDLDGTPSDPSLGIGRSLDHALLAHGFPPVPNGALSRFIGPPLDEAFAELTGSRDAALLYSLVAKYRERYASVGYAENVLYPGIPEVLGRLSEDGPLALCTSKRRDYAERILQLSSFRHSSTC